MTYVIPTVGLHQPSVTCCHLRTSNSKHTRIDHAEYPQDPLYSVPSVKTDGAGLAFSLDVVVHVGLKNLGISEWDGPSFDTAHPTLLY